MPVWNQPPHDLPPGADWHFKDRKVLAGIMGIVFGSLGVHKFILGFVKQGVIMAAVSVGSWLVMMLSAFLPFVAVASTSSNDDPSGVWIALMVVLLIASGIAMTAVWVIGLVEGIIYLTKSDRDFVIRYGVDRRAWF